MDESSVMRLSHNGSRLSFDAELIAGGRTINIRLSGGSSHAIQVPENMPPLEGVMPSVEGEVLYCLHVGGGESFCDTMTGQWLRAADLPARDQHFIG